MAVAIRLASVIEARVSSSNPFLEVLQAARDVAWKRAIVVSRTWLIKVGEQLDSALSGLPLCMASRTAAPRVPLQFFAAAGTIIDRPPIGLAPDVRGNGCKTRVQRWETGTQAGRARGCKPQFADSLESVAKAG